MDAFRLTNINGTESTFQKGHVPDLQHISASYFFVDTSTVAKLIDHPAPRQQYVLTLKGRLEFTVTNGDTFIIEPGVLLVAQDVHGVGHKWKILDGEEWHRVYIVPEHGDEFLFLGEE